MFIETIPTEGLAHLSHLIGDASAGVAAAIDPRRDVEVYLEIARERGVRITHVLETHVHADFVSGSLELAERTGAEICVGGAGAEYGFEARRLVHGDVLEIGGVRLEVLHTPGHTPEHLCYLVGGGRGAEAPWGLFTGDTLFAGEVGRPDLLGEEAAEPLARQLYRSLHEVILPLGDGVEILPAHGRGSPCGATIGDRRTSTIGYERGHNPRLQATDEDTFVRDILESAPEAPVYYPRMKRVNAAGPDILGRIPPVPSLDAAGFGRAAEAADAIIVDTREIEAWGGAHIPGSLNIALRKAFPIWAGWLLRPEQRVLLVTERPTDVEIAQRHLLRIGIETIGGYLARGFRQWSEAGRPFESAGQLTVHELRERAAERALQIVDVRSDREWGEGRIPGARHLFAPHVAERAGELDRDRPTAVYCGSGYRASMAASILKRLGFPEVYNVPGSIGAWKAAGYPLEEG